MIFHVSRDILYFITYIIYIITTDCWCILISAYLFIIPRMQVTELFENFSSDILVRKWNEDAVIII